MSRAERGILKSTYTISRFEVQIDFPQKYQDEEVVYRPFDFQRSTDGRQYTLPMSAYPKPQKDGQTRSDEVWIVFPDPRKNVVDSYKILVTLFSGITAIALSFQSMKREHIRKWYIGAGAAAVVLAALIYFYMNGPQGTDMLVWAAALVLPSLWGISGWVYLIVARRFQAIVKGRISRVGQPGAVVAKAVLFSVDGDGGRKKRSEVSTFDGEYEFHVWRLKPRARHQFLITAEGYDGGNAETKTFSLSTGEEPTVPPTLELPAHNAPGVAVGGGRQFQNI